MGVGIGNFSGSYGDAQAAYFASSQGAEREEYVAGMSYPFSVLPFLVVLVFLLAWVHTITRHTDYKSVRAESRFYVFTVLQSCQSHWFLAVYTIAISLAKLYLETGNTLKAKEMALLVQTKEPKVQSTAVNEMRSEIKKILQNELE
jgi:predicted membrane protein